MTGVRMTKEKKQKKHRLFWFIIKLQIVLMVVFFLGIGVYSYGGYAKQIEEFQKLAVKLVENSDTTTFIPSQGVAMGFVGNYAPRGLTPQTDGMPVIHEKHPASHRVLSSFIGYSQ